MKIKVDDGNKKFISKINLFNSEDPKNLTLDSSGNISIVESEPAFGEATSETHKFVDKTILKEDRNEIR